MNKIFLVKAKDKGILLMINRPSIELTQTEISVMKGDLIVMIANDREKGNKTLLEIEEALLKKLEMIK